MREFIDEHAIANAIKMTRTADRRTAMIVEGPSDFNFFASRIKNESVLQHIAHGKENAVRAMRILNAEQFQRVICVVDSDFMRIQGEWFPEANIFWSDLHDLECMLINSSALSRLLVEFAEAGRLQVFREANGGIPLAEILAGRAVPIGAFLLACQRAGLPLKFEGIRFSRFVDQRTLKIDLQTLIREVKNKTQAHGEEEQRLRGLIEAVMGEDLEIWDLVRGHDIIELLSIGLCHVFGSSNSGQVAGPILERSLRLGYPDKEFDSTELSKRIHGWSVANNAEILLGHGENEVGVAVTEVK